MGNTNTTMNPIYNNMIMHNHPCINVVHIDPWNPNPTYVKDQYGFTHRVHQEHRYDGPTLFDAAEAVSKSWKEYNEKRERRVEKPLAYDPERFWSDLKPNKVQTLHIELTWASHPTVRCTVGTTDLVANCLERELGLKKLNGLKICFTNSQSKPKTQPAFDGKGTCSNGNMTVMLPHPENSVPAEFWGAPVTVLVDPGPCPSVASVDATPHQQVAVHDVLVPSMLEEESDKDKDGLVTDPFARATPLVGFNPFEMHRGETSIVDPFDAEKTTSQLTVQESDAFDDFFGKSVDPFVSLDSNFDHFDPFASPRDLHNLQPTSGQKGEVGGGCEPDLGGLEELLGL